jgi:hypothetical protein
VGFAKNNDSVYAYYSNYFEINQVIAALIKSIDLTIDTKRAFGSSPKTYSLNIQFEVSDGIIYVVASEQYCARNKCFSLMTRVKDYYMANNYLSPVLFETYMHDLLKEFNDIGIAYPPQPKPFIVPGQSTPLMLAADDEDCNSISNGNGNNGNRCYNINAKYIYIGIFAVAFIIGVVALTYIIILTR